MSTLQVFGLFLIAGGIVGIVQRSKGALGWLGIENKLTAIPAVVISTILIVLGIALVVCPILRG